MAIIQATNVTKYYGPELIFKGLNFAINEKERVALVGANGCGKSTLIKIILGIEGISHNDYNELPGNIAIPKNVVVGYLSQNVIENAHNTLLEEALSVFKKQIQSEKELEEIASKMASDPQNEILQQEYARKITAFESIGGYDYHYLIEMILLKFGFVKEDFNRPIDSFSGGERTKMAFAKLLLIQPDLLILDEPTNHLDISTIDWLENYLKSYPGTILFVSHDRYFIDHLATRILELENKELTSYKGNYTQYLQEKSMRYELQLKNYNKQQKEIEKLKKFIEYFKPKPRFVSRAKDREKKLEHMKLVDKPLQSKHNIKIDFKNEALSNKKIMEFENATFGYSTDLFTPISLTMFSNDHLAIMGDNGCGKTTVLKTIMGNLKLRSGDIKFLRSLNIGYLPQNDFELDNFHGSVLEYIASYFPNMLEKDIRNHLGKFGFFDDDVFKQVSVLSGGEKKCLLLARLVLVNYDLLILDEPTNHLDLLTKEALIKALESFTGALIIVSHDRYFVDTLANKIIYIAEHHSIIHEGGYEELKDKLEALTPSAKVSKKEVKSKAENKQVSKMSKAKCEEKCASLEQKIEEIKKAQFLEENYMDAQKMQELEDALQKYQEEYNSLIEYYFATFE